MRETESDRGGDRIGRMSGRGGRMGERVEGREKEKATKGGGVEWEREGGRERKQERERARK